MVKPYGLYLVWYFSDRAECTYFVAITFLELTFTWCAPPPSLMLLLSCCFFFSVCHDIQYQGVFFNWQLPSSCSFKIIQFGKINSVQQVINCAFLNLQRTTEAKWCHSYSIGHIFLSLVEIKENGCTKKKHKIGKIGMYIFKDCLIRDTKLQKRGPDLPNVISAGTYLIISQQWIPYKS